MSLFSVCMFATECLKWFPGPWRVALPVTDGGPSQWSWLNPNYGDNSFTHLPVRERPCCVAQAKRPACQRLRGLRLQIHRGVGWAQLRQARAPTITCGTNMSPPLTGLIYKKESKSSKCCENLSRASGGQWPGDFREGMERLWRTMHACWDAHRGMG